MITIYIRKNIHTFFISLIIIKRNDYYLQVFHKLNFRSNQARWCNLEVYKDQYETS